MPSVTPETSTGALRLTQDGHWLHDGTRVRHARLAALLTRSIARDADGRLVVTTGRDAMPFHADDAPLHLSAVEGADGVLADGLRVRLGPLYVDDEGRMRTPVETTRGTFWALLSRSATLRLIAQADDQGVIPFPDGARALIATAPRDWSAPPTPEAWRAEAIASE